MSNRLGKIIGCLAVLGSATACFAQTTSIELPRDNPVSQIKVGAGDEVVGRNCALCHSTDYIVGQPHLDAQRWSAEVQKMIKTYGAPISDADAKIIADYLAKNYGAEAESQKSAPPNPPKSQLTPNEDCQHAEGVHGTNVEIEDRLDCVLKTPRVRIKIVLLLLAALSAVSCASNSANTQGKGTPSGMPEVTVNAPERKVKATINF